MAAGTSGSTRRTFLVWYVHLTVPRLSLLSYDSIWVWLGQSSGLTWQGYSWQHLSASGYYATPDIGYDWDTNKGRPFNYFCYGAACCEVEIDTLTGDHDILSADIVMDVGASLNPAIDVGQVEGAFVQGCGLFTLEEMIYSPAGGVGGGGVTFTRGPGMYKIPGFKDIPLNMLVYLLV